MKKQRLNVSHWKKSCPKCSIRAGRLVFKDYPEAFGETPLRAKSGAQSWCIDCRKK